MWRVFGWALSWFTREAIVKFALIAALYAALVLLVPMVVSQLGSFINPSGLTSSFASLPAGIWYFLELFRLDFGLPLCISAMVAKFLIRRMPVIG